MKKYPKKENEVPVFIVVKIHNRRGREIVRLRKYGNMNKMENHFTSTEPNQRLNR